MRVEERAQVGAGGLRFSVLGPLTASRAGQQIELGWAKQQSVLAVLLLEMNRPVSVAKIVDAVWGQPAPRDARNALQTNISRLRRVLESAPGNDESRVLISTEGGYLLRGRPEHVDIAIFDRHLATAHDGRQRGDLPSAAAEIDLALAVWRGEPFSGLSGPLIDAERQRLHQRHIDALELRATIMMDRGLDEAAVADLSRLVNDYPLQERLRAKLMVALYRIGRQADALAVFQDIRQRLADELGVDPGRELSELHQQILRADPAMAGPARPVAPAVRNDLPGDIADFTGRTAEMTRLLTARTSTAKVSAIVIGAIDGMAGVGKTTLAVHAAHRLTHRYPDAQLFIDLHGHTSSQRPVTPQSALDTLLRALGVPTDRIPNDLEARAALWRAELANRSALIVLDNAADAAQVRPLLPGAAQSLVLITSRRRLLDLDLDHTLSLDVLPSADAVALFVSVVGDDRTTAEADAVHDVIEQCGYLPLAIRIAAARLRTRPAWTVAYLAGRLRQARSPVTELSAGDRSVAAAFSLSYQHLETAQQRMFRLLGVHPGPDFDVPAAAALAAIEPAAAERLLEDLVDAHLLQQPTVGRYRFHDLLRQHAHITAQTDEPETVRTEALRRVVDFYLHTAYNGSRLLDEQHPPIEIEAPAAGCVPGSLADDAAAMVWFDDNHNCVLAARTAAEDKGWDTAVWQLAWTLDNFHYRRGGIHANVTAWRAGLAAAERLGDLAVQARAHRRLGLTLAPTGKTAEAHHHLRQSLALSEQIGDTLGEAGAHFVLALTWARQQDDHQALAHATRALVLYRTIGNSKWEVRSLSMIGACHTRLGDHDRARGFCESALKLCRRQDDHYGQADSLDSLGAIASHTGQYTEAAQHYEQALALWIELDNTYRQADTLAEIAATHVRLDHHDHARRAWRQAVDLYRSQRRDAEVQRTEQLLADLDRRPG
jgi:DNA-binding SARP family transcriptional activator